MEENIFYDNIQKALENLPENFNILEEKIDMEVQMKYFEHSAKERDDDKLNELFENRAELFDSGTDDDRKMEILSGIAVVDDVAAYRTIERYLEETEQGMMRHWAILALQESRMLLQSSLLEEQQVFISTGLGGKGKKLRYFVVFIHKNGDELNSTQAKLIRDELIFELKKWDGEFEVADHTSEFSTAQIMLPLKVDIRQVFRNIMDEFNQYGNFLKDVFIVTNVKVMSEKEIRQLLDQNQKTNEGFELEEESD